MRQVRARTHTHTRAYAFPDYGVANFEVLRRACDFPWLLSNVLDPETGERGDKYGMHKHSHTPAACPLAFKRLASITHALVRICYRRRAAGRRCAQPGA